MAENLGTAITWVSGFESGRRGGKFAVEDHVLIGHSARGWLV